MDANDPKQLKLAGTSLATAWALLSPTEPLRKELRTIRNQLKPDHKDWFGNDPMVRAAIDSIITELGTRKVKVLKATTGTKPLKPPKPELPSYVASAIEHLKTGRDILIKAATERPKVKR